jgi:hypothetical protein
MTEEERYLNETGEQIALMLGMKKDKQGRYATTWGNKTAIGLSRTINRLAIAINTQEKIEA